MICPHLEQREMSKKERGVATAVYVKNGCRSKFPSTHSNTHTTMATPLPLSVEIALCSRYETVIWAAFLFLLTGLMRVFMIFGSRKLFFKVIKLS